MYLNIIEIARKTIQIEGQSILGLLPLLDNNFEEVVKKLHSSLGRVIITGIGKSAIIAQKIVATFNSTGTASLFMHAADAIHGDLGMIQKDDVVIIISKSGESPEIKVLLPLVKSFGNIVVGLVGNIDSFLAKQSDYVLNATVSVEACPNNLAPTSSTTAQMVIGDALAVSLMELNNFSGKDFAKYHPGGNLGKKLYLKVSDLIINNEIPKVYINSTLKDVIFEITKARLGVTAVLDETDSLIGIITDGDLRRMLEKRDSLAGITAADILTNNPKTIDFDLLAVNALEILKKYDISQILVLRNNLYVGVLHIHDLIREGIV